MTDKSIFEMTGDTVIIVNNNTKLLTINIVTNTGHKFTFQFKNYLNMPIFATLKDMATKQSMVGVKFNHVQEDDGIE